MLPAPFKVVVDANVLFPFSLRDTILRAAAADLFQLYWSEEIIEEARSALIDTGTITEEQADRLTSAMKSAFPEAMVSDYEHLVPAMKNEEEDRHVAAAAVGAGAQVIVTANLKDFGDLPEGIEAQSPDEFLCDLLDLDPGVMADLLHQQASALKNPPRSFDELLDGLAKMVPDFIQGVREYLESVAE